MIHSNAINPANTDSAPLNDKAKQMHIDGWSSIVFNWATYTEKAKTRFVFFGCNSAFKTNSFAKKVSALPNYSGTKLINQRSSSFPSIFPDYKVTIDARSIPIFGGIGWDIANTYTVDSSSGKGWDSITWEGLKTTNLEDFPKAKVMRFYTNNHTPKISHQGILNDHR